MFSDDNVLIDDVSERLERENEKRKTEAEREKTKGQSKYNQKGKK